MLRVGRPTFGKRTVWPKPVFTKLGHGRQLSNPGKLRSGDNIRLRGKAGLLAHAMENELNCQNIGATG